MKFKLTPEQKAMFRTTYALRDNEHWAVWICLVNKDVKSLTELTALFDSSYHELLPILEDLMVGGLVEQFIVWEWDYGDLDKRYYRATTAGLIWLTRIFDELIPRKGHGRYDHHGRRRDLNESKPMYNM